MSYTSIDSKGCSFFTKEQGILFSIRLNEELSKANIMEVKRRIERMPYDWWVIRRGIEIRGSLSQDQKQDVLKRIAEVTNQDFDYCREQEIVMFSKHVLFDYLQEKPGVLSERGWSANQLGLLTEVTRTLINAIRVEKAMIHFRRNGLDKKPLTYTIMGNDEGMNRKASIAFQSQPVVPHEKILIVTVLRTSEKRQSPHQV